MNKVFDFSVETTDYGSMGSLLVTDDDLYVEMYFHRYDDQPDEEEINKLSEFIVNVFDNRNDAYTVNGEPKFMLVDDYFEINLNTSHFSCNFDPLDTTFRVDLSEPSIRTQLIETLDDLSRWLRFG